MSGSRKMSSLSTGGLSHKDTNLEDKKIEFKSEIGEEEDDKPAWSDLKTKAGKERKRLPLACIACRRKKIRCSGEKPACKHCSKARIPCVYKVTARKPAPRTDYMTMLDKRLKRMEERVIKLSPVHDAAKLGAIGRSSVKPYIAPIPKSTANKKRSAEDDLNDWASEQSRLQHSHGVSSVDLRHTSLLKEGSEYLPSQEMQEHLSEVFFEYLYGQAYHVLHKPSYMRKLKAGKVPPVLILTICALSARFSTHPQINSEPGFLRGEEWAEPARQIALKRYGEPSITILIVYLLLGLHEFGTCQGGRSWMFGGMALRMAYALQLHHELDHNPYGQKDAQTSELSYTDREIRRRTMWACFLMDRFNSSGTDRPVFASEDSINIQLPIKEFNFQMEIPGTTEDIEGNVPRVLRDDPEQVQIAKDNLGLAAYIIRIVSLWGKVVKYVNLGGKQKDMFMWEKESEFNKIKQQLKDFIEELPQELRYTPETLENHASASSANQLIFMHVACSQIVLFLHKFAIPAGPGLKLATEAPREFITQSTKNALEAASRISMLVKDAVEYRVSAPFVGYCAFAASTIHIWGIFSSNASLEAISKKNLIHGIRYLTQMKRYWGMFHHMIENLKAIYKQHADWALKGRQARVGVKGEETMFQYGDWFNRFPHGVSGWNFEDPAIPGGVDDSADAPLYEKPELTSPEDLFREAANTILPIPRKAARKAPQTVKSSSRSNKSNTKKDAQASGPPDESQLLRNLSLSPDTSSNNTTLGTPNLATNYDPSVYPDTQGMSAYTLNNQPLAMSELDRQLVFGAYSQDFSTNSPQATYSATGLQELPQQIQIPPIHQQQPAQPQTQGQNLPHQVLQSQSAPVNPMLWESPVDYGMTMLGGAQGFQDPFSSSAWTMPFNTIPPEIGGSILDDNRQLNPEYGLGGANNMDTEST